MLKLVPELTDRQKFEKQTFERWKEYQPQKKIVPIPKGERYLDIGCGSFAWESVEQEFWVLDVCPRNVGAKFVQECFPQTTLPDSYFDVVFCIDLIPELPENLYRLAVSELARIMTREGKLVISAEMDTKTRGACSRFRSLIRTEFVIEEERATYLPFRKLLFGESACNWLLLVVSKRKML